MQDKTVKTPKTTTLSIRVEPQQEAALTELADAYGMTLAEYIRKVFDREADILDKLRPRLADIKVISQREKITEL